MFNKFVFSFQAIDSKLNILLIYAIDKFLTEFCSSIFLLKTGTEQKNKISFCFFGYIIDMCIKKNVWIEITSGSNSLVTKSEN